MTFLQKNVDKIKISKVGRGRDLYFCVFFVFVN